MKAATATRGDPRARRGRPGRPGATPPGPKVRLGAARTAPSQGNVNFQEKKVFRDLILPKLWGRGGSPNTQAGFVLSPARFSVCVAGTKSGKTLGCVLWLLAQAWERKHVYLWVAPSYRQTKVAFRLMVDLVPETCRYVNEGMMTLRLSSGSLIEFRTAERPDLLFGSSYAAAVVDEASRMREEAWNAVQSTLTVTRGPAKLIANARGRRNWFYRLYRKAEQGEPGFSAHIMKSSANPHLVLEEIDDARRRLPDQKFRELYEAEFFDDAARIFGQFEKCIREAPPGHPLEGHLYSAGLDLAKHEDWTVMVVGDDELGQALTMDRFQGLPWPATRARIRSRSEEFNGIDIEADSTGLGDPVVDELKREGLRVRGYTFTGTSKAQLIEALMVDIENEAIHFPEWPQLGQELDVFEGERMPSGYWRYSAPDDGPDDCVVGLALWNWARRRRVLGSHYGLVQHMRKQTGWKAPADPARTAELRKAVAAFETGQLVECSREDYQEVRALIQERAGQFIDQGDHVRAQIGLQEVQRLDQKFDHQVGKETPDGVPKAPETAPALPRA